MTETIIPEQANVKGNYADFGKQPSFRAPGLFATKTYSCNIGLQ